MSSVWNRLVNLANQVIGTLAVTHGGTGVTTSTGSGSTVLSTSPTLVTPVLGTPTSGTMTNVTGLPLTTGVTGTLPIGNGGTNATTKAAAFDSLSPMTNAGDIIYGGASGTGTRLAAGTTVQVLHGGTTPSYSAVSLTADVAGILPIANGGTASATFIQTGSLNTTFSAGGTSASVTVRYQRLGDWVTLNIPPFTLTASGSPTIILSNSAISATFTPATNQARVQSLPITNNNTQPTIPGEFLLGQNGIIGIQLDGAGSAFANSTVGIFRDTAVSYYVGSGS